MAKRNSRTISAREAKELDLRAKEEFGIPTLLLMENAGKAVSEEVLKIIAGKKARVAIFCGKGNNGGDGFCVARHLLAAGIDPDVYLAGKINEIKGEVRVNLDILLRLGKKIFETNEQNIDIVRRRISKYSFIIDALLGVGVKGEVRGVVARLIQLINGASANILSVDIPSGLEATSGEILGCCVKANKTVTFVARKTGMLKYAGRKFCGKIIVSDIGVPYF